MVEMFVRCRNSMGGYSCLPEAGGYNDQPAWLMDAFDVIDAAFDAMRPRS